MSSNRCAHRRNNAAFGLRGDRQNHRFKLLTRSSVAGNILIMTPAISPGQKCDAAAPPFFDTVPNRARVRGAGFRAHRRAAREHDARGRTIVAMLQTPHRRWQRSPGPRPNLCRAEGSFVRLGTVPQSAQRRNSEGLSSELDGIPTRCPHLVRTSNLRRRRRPLSSIAIRHLTAT